VRVRDYGNCNENTFNLTIGTLSVNAGPDQSSCGSNFTMAAQALTQGDTGLWTVVSGGAVIIDNPASPTTTVIIPGTSATLRWTVDNSACEASDDVVLTINANNTITLSSAAGTNNQTLCAGTPITDITYSTTGATDAIFSDLPEGVIGSWESNVVTISGTPAASGTFNYTVELTGGCGTVMANGTITVIAPLDKIKMDGTYSRKTYRVGSEIKVVYTITNPNANITNVYLNVRFNEEFTYIANSVQIKQIEGDEGIKPVLVTPLEPASLNIAGNTGGSDGFTLPTGIMEIKFKLRAPLLPNVKDKLDNNGDPTGKKVDLDIAYKLSSTMNNPCVIVAMEELRGNKLIPFAATTIITNKRTTAIIKD
jgi:hypothetical protein